MTTKQYDNYADLITFTRGSSGTALRPVGYGAELVTNGTFDSAANWTLTGSAAISGGQVTLSTQFDALAQSINITNGQLVRISYQVVSNTDQANNNLSLSSQGFTGATTYINNDVGTHTLDVVVVDATKPLRFVLANATTIVLDNISVKEVIFDRAGDPLTLFNHPTNVPRIEYDASGNRKGLLIEEARTNLQVQSEGNFNTPTGATYTYNQAVSPDGNTSGTLAQATAGSGLHALPFSQSFVSGTTYTASFFVKKGNQRYIYSSAGNPAIWDAAARFDLDTGAVSFVGAGSASTQDVGNGWYRFSITATASATGTTNFNIWMIDQTNFTTSWTATGSETVYIFGIQIEAGSFPTSYIPTSGSTATRSADVASIPTSAFGYNSKVGAGGTVIVDFQSDNWRYAPSTDFLRVWEFDGSQNNGLYRDAPTGEGNRFRYRLNDTSGTAVLGADTISPTVANSDDGAKIAISYARDDFAVYANGTQHSLDPLGVFANQLVTKILIGAASPTGGSYANGHIKSIQYYPRRLSNAQLQRLTA